MVFLLALIILIHFEAAEATAPGFWRDQFEIFRARGFFKNDIAQGKNLYFTENFVMKKEGVQMQLWTISEGNIYLEEMPNKETFEKTELDI